ncbi:MAG: Nre family DNA repair protein [Thermoplasmata archaeon]
MCVACKASKRLCGKPRCPLLVRYHSLLKTVSLVSLHMAGSSPPGFFAGRFGYPKLNIGPLVPPFYGNTALLDHPEEWLNFSIDDIVGFRSQLVRGLHRVNVAEARDGGKLVGRLQELAIAASPSDVELDFMKRPRGNIVFRDNVQPYGPSAPLRRMEAGTLSVHRDLERVWYDGDLRAHDALLWLYTEGVEVSRISRALSAGILGLQAKRKFVPTRWSITAVDDAIGKHLVQKAKGFPLINEFRVYESWKLDNRFMILLVPRSWIYELVEAWYPGSTWNPTGRRIAMFADWEGYRGRTTYAAIGGCYYAARLAIAEALCGEGRQAGALVLREAHPGYILPVGVWNVRENVRRAMREPYREFTDLSGALHYIAERLEISLKQWMGKSRLLRYLQTQRVLEDYPGVGG